MSGYHAPRLINVVLYTPYYLVSLCKAFKTVVMQFLPRKMQCNVFKKHLHPIFLAPIVDTG